MNNLCLILALTCLVNGMQDGDFEHGGQDREGFVVGKEEKPGRANKSRLKIEMPEETETKYDDLSVVSACLKNSDGRLGVEF